MGPTGSVALSGVEPILDPDAAAALEAPMADSTPDVIDGVALARLYGEPLFKLPEDLYIPPDALEVFLEAFEGPLDLLLYLIRKQHFNVLDIPMAPLTVQYLAYIDQIRAKNLELAAEYLLMAALLIEIKSRMLLPVRKADTGEEVEDPRAELVRRLLEYEQMKLAALRIDELPRVGRDFVRAIVVIEQSIEKRFPDDAHILLERAWVHSFKGNWRQALTDARRAAEIDPKLADALTVQGIRHLRAWKRSSGAGLMLARAIPAMLVLMVGVRLATMPVFGS